jgi:hypothetical protein
MWEVCASPENQEKTRGLEAVKKSPNISAKKCAIARTLEM